MQKQTLTRYVFSAYPSEAQNDFHEFCETHEDDICTWEDFATRLAEFVHEENISVAMSSTWAVCQEFLGKLSGQELRYAQGRGGFWSMSDLAPRDVVSAREVLTDVRERYPC